MLELQTIRFQPPQEGLVMHSWNPDMVDQMVRSRSPAEELQRASDLSILTQAEKQNTKVVNKLF